MSSATADLVNHPTAGVAASLAQWRGTIETLMDSTFNPDRSTSAFGKLDQILADANTDQFNATRRLLNPDTDDSPMARLLASVQSQISTVLEAVSVLSDKVAGGSAAKIAVSAMMERSAVKGTSFEEQVVRTVTAIGSRPRRRRRAHRPHPGQQRRPGRRHRGGPGSVQHPR